MLCPHINYETVNVMMVLKLDCLLTKTRTSQMPHPIFGLILKAAVDGQWDKCKRLISFGGHVIVKCIGPCLYT